MLTGAFQASQPAGPTPADARGAREGPPPGAVDPRDLGLALAAHAERLARVAEDVTHRHRGLGLRAPREDEKTEHGREAACPRRFEHAHPQAATRQEKVL